MSAATALQAPELHQAKALHELPNPRMSARVPAVRHPRVGHPRIRVLVSHGWREYRSRFLQPRVPVGCIHLPISRRASAV